jgi:hypothetical protein
VERVRGLLRVSLCELLLLDANSWSTGTVREPRGRVTSAVGIRYQKSGEDSTDWEDLSVCCTEQQVVWMCDNAIVTCNYGLLMFNKPSYQSKLRLLSLSRDTILIIFLNRTWEGDSVLGYSKHSPNLILTLCRLLFLFDIAARNAWKLTQFLNHVLAH